MSFRTEDFESLRLPFRHPGVVAMRSYGEGMSGVCAPPTYPDTWSRTVSLPDRRALGQGASPGPAPATSDGRPHRQLAEIALFVRFPFQNQ